ncbi:MAG: alpha/beta hydrolase family protein [Abditibacteriaceae bacterium]
MKPRNYSPQEMFQQMANAHQPQYRFEGEDEKYFSQWKENTLPKVLSTLGKSPPCCAPNPHFVAEWMHDGLRKQRWEIDVNPWLSAMMDVNFPGDLQNSEKRAAILVCIGHDPTNGRKSIMGNAMPDNAPDTPVPPDAFGHHLAKDGFVTFGIDWIALGDQNDSGKPNHNTANGNSDWCNIYYLHSTMLGMTNLSINISHAKAAIDFATTLPGIDKNALGVMGSSGGGTMSLWISLCDERIKATEIICYSDLFAYFGVRDVNYCGMQITPGLFNLVDLPDLQGLIAPRPLLVDIGARDECFRLESAMECFRGVEKIYKAADAAENLHLDFHPGGHHWGGNKSASFFREYLQK